MTHFFENRLITGITERGDHNVQHTPRNGPPAWYVCERYENYEFRKCSFESCALSVTRDPKKRSIFRDIRLIDCQVRGCSIDTAILEDIYIERLATHNLLCCWGSVFKHVTLKGHIGSIMLSPSVAAAMATPEEQSSFDEANAVFYTSVDWALDISQAEFEVEPDIRRIPARLIRRDPETQIVVTRGKAASKRAVLNASDTYWGRWLCLFLDDPFKPDDVVLAVPKRHRKYKDLLDGIKLLREMGIVESE